MSTFYKESRFICGMCGEWYVDVFEAEICCPTESNEFMVYVCTRCYNEYVSKGDAEECYANDGEQEEEAS